MTKDQIEELAVLIREGKATENQKVEFLKVLSGELKDVSSILKAVTLQKGA